MLSSLFYIGSIEVMDDRSWMYQDLSQGLRRMNYCNVVRVLLITQYLIQKISMEAVLDFQARDVKIKSFSIQML
jgi:hypothetical protein